MKAPTIIGCPLWLGPIKPRVAKKWLRRFHNDWMLHHPLLSHLTIGDIINTCSGLNSKILSVKPDYISIGTTGRCHVLVDVDIMTTDTGCSLSHCGVEPALPREVIEARFKDSALEWTLTDTGRLWWGDDYPRHEAMAHRRLQALERGEHFISQEGRMLDEYNEYKVPYDPQAEAVSGQTDRPTSVS